MGLPSHPGSGGWGARLVDGCLGAASGAMPSWMMTPLASTLHAAWNAVGTPVFTAWLREALDKGRGAPAGWKEMQPPESR